MTQIVKSDGARTTVTTAVQNFFNTVCHVEFERSVAILTLLLLGFYGMPNAAGGYYKPAVIVALIPAVLYPPLLRSTGLWLFLALVYSVAFFRDWYPIDNHKYVTLYWIIIVACATTQKSKDYERFLGDSARFFLVFVMGIAAFQKLTQTSYVDSSFFELELLIDRRFETLSVFFGADRLDLEFNRDIMSEFKRDYLDGETGAMHLRGYAQVEALAFWVTWWDVGVQVAIAACFALRRRLSDLLGHILLLTFIVTTYFFAPVIGFGWIIAILGFAMAAPNWPSLRLVYFMSLPLLTIYAMPWGNLIARFI